MIQEIIVFEITFLQDASRYSIFALETALGDSTLTVCQLPSSCPSSWWGWTGCSVWSWRGNSSRGQGGQAGTCDSWSSSTGHCRHTVKISKGIFPKEFFQGNFFQRNYFFRNFFPTELFSNVFMSKDLKFQEIFSNGIFFQLKIFPKDIFSNEIFPNGNVPQN